MGIASDVSALKTLSDGVVANKVSRFAYTEQAYTDNEVDGVIDYDVNRGRNIPVGTASVMKVNQTVIEKGWRARASSITRMLMNHFLGRISYNLNKVSDWFNSFLGSMSSYLGAPNGIATLDQDGRIPYSQLPESAIELKGYWDASTNTPALVDGTGTNGDEYIVSVAGTRDLGSGAQYFGVGDRVLYTSDIWKNISSGFVKSVNTQTPDAQGNVVNVVGKPYMPISQSILSTIFGRLLARVWKAVWTANVSNIAVIKYANGLCLCSTSGDGLWWSDNGVQWEKCSGFTTEKMTNIFYANEVWFATEHASDNSVPSRLWRSLDGKNWVTCTGLDDLATNHIQLSDLMYGGGVWLTWASGTASSTYWSEDGLAWTHVTVEGQSTLWRPNAGCVYANGIWVASSATAPTGGMMWSNDGKDWNYATGLTSGKAGRYPVYFEYNNKWVCSLGDTGIWYSTDGKAWTQSNLNTGVVRAIIQTETQLICSVEDGGIRVSSSGTTWVTTSCTTETFSALKYANHICVAHEAGNQSVAGRLFWSEDFNTWTSVARYRVGVLNYANGLWLGAINYSGNGFLYSEDGKNWYRSETESRVYSTPVLAFGFWLAFSGNIIYKSSVDGAMEEGLIDLSFLNIVD